MTTQNQFLDRLRLRHLRLLDLMDRHASLRAIADILNLSQPALSQMVKDLEHALGVQLVDRSARGVVLNAAGRLALQRARQGLAAIDQLSVELQTDATPVLRIGTNPMLLVDIFPEVMHRMKAETARVRFEIEIGRESQMVEALKVGDVDCYVGVIDWPRMASDTADMLYHEALYQADLAFVCGRDHPLVGKTGLSARELLDWPWSLQPRGSQVRMLFEKGFRQVGLPSPIPVVEMAADPNAFLNLACRNNLLACVPNRALAHFPRRNLLCQLAVTDLRLDPTIAYFATLRQNRHLEAINLLRTAFADALRLDLG